jgi:hypothetical protein
MIIPVHQHVLSEWLFEQVEDWKQHQLNFGIQNQFHGRRALATAGTGALNCNKTLYFWDHTETSVTLK